MLQSKYKNKCVFPTVLKWSIIAPFNFIMKQKNNKWIPWIFAFGFPKTGKTTLGDISCAIWGHYLDDSYKIPFTNIDTIAKFGEYLSKSTFPLLVNEAGILSDDSKL